MIELFIEQTKKLNPIEKMWCNWVYRFFYGHKDKYYNKTQIINYVVQTQHAFGNDIKRLDGPRFRKVIHFIRNEIIPLAAGKIIREEYIVNVPPSYFKGMVWICAGSEGYMATDNLELIREHEKSLESRIAAMELDLESSNLVELAIIRCENDPQYDALMKAFDVNK